MPADGAAGLADHFLRLACLSYADDQPERWAAACRQPSAVGLLVELGFDVNAKGRTDVPSDQPWQTALHSAAESGDLSLARTLLRLGADPDIRDQRFNSTPLGWGPLLRPGATGRAAGADHHPRGGRR